MFIADDGAITVQPQGASPNQLAVVDRIKMVNPDAANLYKGEDGLMRIDVGGVAPQDTEVELASGYLEVSNVNAVAELTSMLDLARRFEMNVKMMSTTRDNADASTRILQNLG